MDWEREFKGYETELEPSKRERAYSWMTAIGLQDVDGLKTSNFISCIVYPRPSVHLNRCAPSQSERHSLVQPIEGDFDLWSNRNQNTLDQSAITEVRHSASDGRAADMEFSRNSLPVRSGESRLRIDPSLERIQDLLVEIKRKTRRTSPRIPRHSMCLSHNLLPLSFFDERFNTMRLYQKSRPVGLSRSVSQKA